MNYQHHYNLLIERQKNRLLEGYKERHHIVPRCLGGKDVPENLVDLTAREHFVQHQLLAKIYPDHKGLQLAVSMMSTNGTTQERTENRRYQWVRERHQKQISELMSGENNHQFGTKWIHKGTESKKVPKDSLKQWLDDGWQLGRYKQPKEPKKGICKVCGQETKTTRSKLCQLHFKEHQERAQVEFLQKQKQLRDSSPEYYEKLKENLQKGRVTGLKRRKE